MKTGHREENEKEKKTNGILTTNRLQMGAERKVIALIKNALNKNEAYNIPGLPDCQMPLIKVDRLRGVIVIGSPGKWINSKKNHDQHLPIPTQKKEG